MSEQTSVDYVPAELDRDATFYVAGHRGLVGSAIWRNFEAQGFTRLVGKSSAELDLKNRDDVFAYMRETKPKHLVLAAAKVGGILANSTRGCRTSLVHGIATLIMRLHYQHNKRVGIGLAGTPHPLEVFGAGQTEPSLHPLPRTCSILVPLTSGLSLRACWQSPLIDVVRADGGA